MPPQEDVLQDLLHPSSNLAPLTKAECLVFSDIRFHQALVLRSQNPHAFRPDLFESHVSASQAILSALSGAEAFIKIRFVSEELLADQRHINVLSRLAGVLLERSGGQIAFDAVSEKLVEKGKLQEELEAAKDKQRSDFHVPVYWTQSDPGFVAETRGLRKVGAPELVTASAPKDQQIVICRVIQELVEMVWAGAKLALIQKVSNEYGDFECMIEPEKKSLRRVRIRRLSSQAD